MVYHIGFRKNGNQLQVFAAQSVDCLPSDIWQYRGRFENTKKQLRANKKNILSAVNKWNGTEFTRVTVY